MLPILTTLAIFSDEDGSKSYNSNLESSEEETRPGFEPKENSGESEGNPEYFFIPSGNLHERLFWLFLFAYKILNFLAEA